MSNPFIIEVERRINLEVSKQVASFMVGQNLEFTIRQAMLAGASIYSKMTSEESAERILKQGGE